MTVREASPPADDTSPEPPDSAGRYAVHLADLFEDMAKQCDIPIVVPQLDLNDLVYLTSNETYVARYENPYLEILLDRSGAKTIGAKITDLASVIDALLENPQTRKFIIDRLHAIEDVDPPRL